MSSSPGFDVDVSVRRGDALIEASFTTGPGLTVLFGPSGVGKSTVLATVAGLVRPERGRVAVAGRTLLDTAAGLDLPPERRRAGLVFQDARLFPHLRVRPNLRYGERLAPAGEAVIGFDEAVAVLGIGHLLDRWPRTLSGGEAQRVAIGRALLAAPRFLLMDEPLASVDRTRRNEILTLVEAVRDRLRLPILYVTHDEREATRLATERVEMV